MPGAIRSWPEDLFQGLFGQQDIGFTNRVFKAWSQNPEGFGTWLKENPPPDVDARIGRTEGTQGREILDAQAKFGEVLLDLGRACPR